MTLQEKQGGEESGGEGAEKCKRERGPTNVTMLLEQGKVWWIGSHPSSPRYLALSGV